MRVVDEQRERPVPGEVRGQPVQPVHDGKRPLRPEWERGGLGECDVEQRRRVARRPLEGCRGIAAVYRGLEQLAHDPEPERALELGPASHERHQPSLARGFARRADQCGLTDPRWALHDDRSTFTRRHGFDGRSDHAKLLAPLQEAAQLAVRHRAHPVGSRSPGDSTAAPLARPERARRPMGGRCAGDAVVRLWTGLGWPV